MFGVQRKKKDLDITCKKINSFQSNTMLRHYVEALSYIKNVPKFPGIQTISSYSFEDPKSAFLSLFL